MEAVVDQQPDIGGPAAREPDAVVARGGAEPAGDNPSGVEGPGGTPAVGGIATQTAAQRWRAIGFMAFAHLVHDGYLVMVGLLLVPLRSGLGFSLALAGLLGPAQQIGSLAQPWIGSLGDRLGTKKFVVGSLAVTGVATSLAALSPSYWVLLVLVFVTGVSSAVYHPNGNVMLTSHAGNRAGTALAVYAFGGNMGQAIWPVIVAAMLGVWGLSSIGLLAIPALVLAAILAFMLRGVHEERQRPGAAHAGWQWWRREWRPLALIGVIIFGRSVGAGGLTLFLPTVLDERGYSQAMIGLVVTSYFAIGGFGALLTGWLSDRLGRLPVMGTSIVLGAIGWFVFVTTDALWTIVPLLVTAACLLGHQPVMTALGQEMYPERRGSIVGYTLGASFVLMSVGTVTVGTLGDAIGLTRAFAYLAFAPLMAIPAIILLGRRLRGGGVR